jgi:hypothetical protein
MHRLERYAHQTAQPQPHEGKMQEVRQERKTEGLRLEGLKKALQAKLSASLAEAKESHAA